MKPVPKGTGFRLSNRPTRLIVRSGSTGEPTLGPVPVEARQRVPEDDQPRVVLSDQVPDHLGAVLPRLQVVDGRPLVDVADQSVVET